MPNQPLLSFVVPVYKTLPEMLAKCLKSIRASTYKNIETIVVFDGEPDKDLEEIATKYADKVLGIEHKGAPAARNAGFAMAKGEYVVAWDADCYAKPDMAKRWIDEFWATDADFVYTGYELTGERGGFKSEPFDAYSLQCGNFISSMSPIKRSKAPFWDESLTAGQDWDFWLTAVELGCKGVFIEGAGFLTEPSEKGSISSEGLAGPNRSAIIKAIREKHNIPDRPIGIFTMQYRTRALKLAKILGADLVKATGYDPAQYKTLINLGYGFLSRFEGIAKDVTKIQFWVCAEIEALKQSKYTTVVETIRIAKEVINLCGTAYERNQLAEIGIEAEVVPLPLTEEDIRDASTELPKDFSILLITDGNYSKLFKEIEQDLPHVTFGYQVGQIKDFSCLMSFYSFAAIDDPIVTAHINGRNVISNVQAPFCGYIDPAQNWEAFKKELYQKIREVRGKPLNREARDYYMEQANPQRFREKIDSLTAPKLEVIS